MKTYLYPANILLPDFGKVDGTKWASIACDQYTGQKEYWEAAYSLIAGSPSTLELMLPEAYLDREDEMTPKINLKMQEYLKDILHERKDSMIYLERTQADGRVRRGLVACIDLEDYDFAPGSSTLIRATEGTVMERIPPRVAIRKGAVLEMPHVMILIDDPDRTVIDPIAEQSNRFKVIYDFDLMAGGGHVKGYLADDELIESVNLALDKLASPDEMKKKYGVESPTLLFAIGDGNHSLATAKVCYEELKAEIGAEKAMSHPARYALCEIVNLHDTALDFEPIYRAVFGVNEEEFISELEKYVSSLCGTANFQSIEVVAGKKSHTVAVPHPSSQLAVGTVQDFLDKYERSHAGVTVDYIHGKDAVTELAQKPGTIALIYDGMTKDMLFKTVICDGALPRKTFSMGHSDDKRFYLECRRIR